MKSLIIKCTIGNINISNDSISSFKLDRNFSDVSNKFTMSLIDSPAVNSLFTDIELYMQGGGRTISVRYGDEEDSLDSLSGTIWSYRSTFVGDVKKLEISGYLTTAMLRQNSTSSSFAYNIDWNSYYNLRADETKMWNVLRQLDRSNGLSNKYNEFMSKNESGDLVLQYDSIFTVYGKYKGSAVDTAVQSSDILDDFFHSLYTFNTAYVTVNGPVGSIKLPVPTSFVSSNSTAVVGKDSDSGKEFIFEEQAVKRFYNSNGVIYKYYSYKDHAWHEVSKDDMAKTSRIYYIFPKNDKNHLVGFKSVEGTYVEINYEKEYAGAGIQLYNSNGVSPSDIVRQLAILEGWEIGNIVDTDLVPCGDTFKMNGKSALQFINENLVPVSILPTGMVKDKNGATVVITSGVGGYHPYFKDGKFYYEPVSTNQFNDITSNVLLGYNLPNSPVLSFQIDTKSTWLYSQQSIKLNALSIVTGEEYEEVPSVSKAQVENFNKTSGFNEGLASFFGLSYEEAKSQGFKISRSGNSYSETLTGETNPYRTDDTPFTFTNPQLILNSTSYADHLVSNLVVSGVSSQSQVLGMLESAKRNLQDRTIKATMTLWGDLKLKPASLIRVTNMVKSTNALYPEQHYSSGVYMIQKQSDEISDSGFIQTLDLLKYTSDVIEGLSTFNNVDWSVSKITPLTSNLTFEQDTNVTENKLPKGYGLISGVKYKDKYLVYSNGSNKIYVPDLGEYINLNDLVKDTSKKTQKFLVDVMDISGSAPKPPKGFIEETPGFYRNGKTLTTSTRFYTPFYGGIYYSVDTWDTKKLKVPSQYNKQFYAQGNTGKFYIDWFYWNSNYKTPDKDPYPWYVGVGILRREG